MYFYCCKIGGYKQIFKNVFFNIQTSKFKGKNKTFRTEDMAKQVKTHATKLEDLSSTLVTHTGLRDNRFS